MPDGIFLKNTFNLSLFTLDRHGRWTRSPSVAAAWMQKSDWRKYLLMHDCMEAGGRATRDAKAEDAYTDIGG